MSPRLVHVHKGFGGQVEQLVLAHKTSFLFSVSIVLAIVCYPIKEGLSRTATQSNLSLTPSSLGFFEHSQPGGGGDSVPPP